jgi:hypothetical protein
MLFQALHSFLQHGAEKYETISTKNIPLQIRSLSTRDLFGRLHTKIIVENLVFLIQLKKVQ